MSDVNSPLLPTAEAAKYLRIGQSLLNRMRRENTGPDYVKLGRKVFYRQVELDKYIESNVFDLQEYNTRVELDKNNKLFISSKGE
jgi:predicted DNA-binding transcriptional regulator AlpA